MKHYILYGISCILAAMTSSCDKAIYEYEHGCPMNYHIRLKYDYNMKRTDAFAKEIKYVSMYLIDQSGRIVLEKQKQVEEYNADKFTVDVTVEPGTYSILTWCTGDNPDDYMWPTTDVKQYLGIQLAAENGNDGLSYSAKNISGLWHGYAENIDFPESNSEQADICVSLTKNTNEFSVSVRQLAGEPLKADEVSFEISDTNSSLNWDNSLTPDGAITYHEFNKRDVTGSGVTAELSTLRLMTENRNKSKLRLINNKTGETIASINVIDAILQAKPKRLKMDYQEYLDRQDMHNVIFFLNADYGFESAKIVINIDDWYDIDSDIDMH